MVSLESKVEIYIWTTCPYCQRALKLLDSKGVEYTKYDITGNDEARQKMIERTGGPKSVPQVFIDGKHYGGCDDLHDLDARGKLDQLLGI